MANNFSITACDNQMIIVAYNWWGSYIIGDVQSGKNNKVDLNVTISAGDYNGPYNYNNVNGDPPTPPPNNVTIPSAKYYLMVIGIDWGGSTAFEMAVNGTQLSAPIQQGAGVVWTPAPVLIEV